MTGKGSVIIISWMQRCLIEAVKIIDMCSLFIPRNQILLHLSPKSASNSESVLNSKIAYFRTRDWKMSRHRSRTDHERASTIDSKSITSYNDWCEDPRAGQPTTHTYPRENHVIVRVSKPTAIQFFKIFETRNKIHLRSEMKRTRCTPFQWFRMKTMIMDRGTSTNETRNQSIR